MYTYSCIYIYIYIYIYIHTPTLHPKYPALLCFAFFWNCPVVLFCILLEFSGQLLF